MGEHTLKIPMTLHQENRECILKRLHARGGYAPGSVILLQGAEDDHTPGSSDIDHVFRQESYFLWAFGVLEPGWYGAIDASNGRTTLFMPRLPQEYAIWKGYIRSPKEYKCQYQVDEVHYVDEIAEVLKKITSGELLTLHGTNSDSKRVTFEAHFEGIGNFTVNNKVLHDEIAECRVHKTEAEIQILKYTTSVSCAAHRNVMRSIRPGMKEYQLESLFQHHTYYHGGCRHQGYTNICGSGPSAAILHYGHAGAPNDRTIKDGDIILLDMGAEYYHYGSDVTVSYPANGRFSDDQKIIYNAVYDANQAVMAVMRPGVSWVAMQSLAYRAMLKKLTEAGLVKGDIDEMMAANIGSIFMPHGLGHLLGVDVHDVGGYLEGHPSRPIGAGYRYIRTARVLQKNMVITVEPGCYFNDHSLDAAFANPDQVKFLVRKEIDRFRGFGGIRIEDTALITESGIENLSHDLPRTVEDIEAFMAAGIERDACVPLQPIQCNK
ncbi:unnamed protein product [Meganyctiphanes norvegica]|uniref:Xaa-Pro dipeptidase n=1 Tax=Meganyctiphanes norvegica TaxID=48144 RepID=A0AAV2R4R5_MEGNR